MYVIQPSYTGGGTMRVRCMAVCELSYSVPHTVTHTSACGEAPPTGHRQQRESRSQGMIQTTITLWMPWDALLTSPCALGVDFMLLGLSLPTPCAPVPYSRPYTHTAPYSPRGAWYTTLSRMRFHNQRTDALTRHSPNNSLKVRVWISARTVQPLSGQRKCTASR